MNAGAYGCAFHDRLVSVDAVDLKSGRSRSFARCELGTGYRRSALQGTNWIVTRATLRLRHSCPGQIREAMRQTAITRRRRFPYGLPNAGSVFKRPDGRPVGAMIEDIGLKGRRCGGAQISPLHGGFIVNGGGATGEQIAMLASEMQRAVSSAFGVSIELEQVVI
jgi:UDP-N-acetylmuramate dehydrogenase